VNSDQPTTIVCHSLDTDKKTATVKAPGKRLQHVQFAPDGSCLFALNSTNTLTAWDYPSGKQRWQVKCDGSSSIRFLPGSTKLVSDGGNVWDVVSGKQEPDRWLYYPLAFHPDNKHAVFHQIQERALVFKNVVTQKEAARIELKPSTGPGKMLFFTPDGSQMIGVGSTIRVWKTPPLTDAKP